MNSPQKRSADEENGTDGSYVISKDAQRYPRKRVAVACEVCRVRKTRCDAARPSCSFCKGLGIECTYKGPSNDDRKSDKTADLNLALRKLESIQSTLDSIAVTIGSHNARGLEKTTPSAYSTSPASYAPSDRRQSTSRMPNLFTFKPSLHSTQDEPWSYDCIEDFFRHQMDVEAELCEASQLVSKDMNLFKPHLWRLQRTFVENILTWLPLFDRETASHHLQTSQRSDFDEESADSCLVLLMYAVGALAADSSLYSPLTLDLPGFNYYARSIKSLRTFPRSGKDLRILQCHILSSIYLLLAMRPLEAWKNIRQASQACILLLKARIVDESAGFREAFHRAYWICYILESELEISLELPASGLRAYEDIVPLPTSHYEEDGIYFLLALSSLRRLMVEVVDTVGLMSPTEANYAPVVTLELRNQIDDWYRHLPASLHFPSDHSLLFDMRRAYLRCMYHALIAVAFWPFVPRVKDISHSGNFNPELEQALSENERNRIRKGAEECLEASRSYLRGAEEILTQKSLVSHLLVRSYSYFTTAMILLLVYPDPTSTTSESFQDQQLLTQAIHNLTHWDIVPFLQKPISEMKRIARLKGFQDV